MTKPCKLCGSDTIEKYRIKWDQHRIIYECRSCGFHFLDAFDGEIGEESPARLTARDEDYIRNSLQSNQERTRWQIDALKASLPHAGSSVLDVGAGGGLFLHLAREAGFHVMGSEPSGSRVQFARKEYDLSLKREVIDHPVWDRHAGKFDAVTLWDVIEHVDDPKKLLQRCKELLRPGGTLLLDTPARDSLFYRSGAFLYDATGGRVQLLLRTMYSPARFGHKQIFRLHEMKTLLNHIGFEIIEAKRFHELSFPRRFYLKRMIRSEIMVRIADYVSCIILAAIPVRNKMFVKARA